MQETKSSHLPEARALSDHLPQPLSLWKDRTSSGLHNMDLSVLLPFQETKPLQLQAFWNCPSPPLLSFFLHSPLSLTLYPRPPQFPVSKSQQQNHTLPHCSGFQPISPLEEGGVAGKRDQGKTAAEKRARHLRHPRENQSGHCVHPRR